MPRDKHRKHTPITSEAQQGLMGAEYARRKEGETPRMPGITGKELKSHLKESKGKKLPKRAKVRKAANGVVVGSPAVSGPKRDTTPRPGKPQEVRTTRQAIFGKR